MLFQNYGLFWHADYIQWGSPGKGNQGRLLGYQTKSAGPVDFRPQRGVYALYDEGYQLLYVGQAGYGNKRLYDRLDNHMSDHLAERWQRFSWFGIDPVRKIKKSFQLVETEPETPQVNHVLNHLEAILIAAAEPRLNRQGGKFGDAQQFRQWEQDDEGDDVAARMSAVEETLKEMSLKLGKL
jgi:hypothetical protein